MRRSPEFVGGIAMRLKGLPARLSFSATVALQVAIRFLFRSRKTLVFGHFFAGMANALSVWDLRWPTHDAIGLT
jgi:hypothetical protein